MSMPHQEENRRFPWLLLCWMRSSGPPVTALYSTFVDSGVRAGVSSGRIENFAPRKLIQPLAKHLPGSTTFMSATVLVDNPPTQGLRDLSTAVGTFAMIFSVAFLRRRFGWESAPAYATAGCADF